MFEIKSTLTPALSRREREPIFSVTKICFCL